MTDTTAPANYGERKTAARAARQALGSDKISGVHFRVTEIGDRFGWEVIQDDASISDPEGGGTPNDDNAADLAAKAEKPKARKAKAAKVSKPKAKPAKAAKTPKAKAAKPKAGKITDNGPGLPKGKLGQVIAMMQRPEGATNAQIQKATGWLPHTIRAAISVSIKRKHGHAVTAEKTDAGTVYKIAA